MSLNLHLKLSWEIDEECLGQESPCTVKESTKAWKKTNQLHSLNTFTAWGLTWHRPHIFHKWCKKVWNVPFPLSIAHKITHHLWFYIRCVIWLTVTFVIETMLSQKSWLTMTNSICSVWFHHLEEKINCVACRPNVIFILCMCYGLGYNVAHQGLGCSVPFVYQGLAAINANLSSEAKPSLPTLVQGEIFSLK